MYRADVGTIAFYWGEAGDTTKKYTHGSRLAHIIAKHGVEVVEQVVETIAQGSLSWSTRRKSRRAFLQFDDGRVFLQLYRDGKPETWLVTGYRRGRTADIPFDLSVFRKPIHHHPN